MDILEVAKDIYFERIYVCLNQRIEPEILRDELLLQVVEEINHYWGLYQRNEHPMALEMYETWSTLKDNLDSFLGDMTDYKLKYYSKMKNDAVFGMN